jgi:hypothetical protein
VSVHIVFLFIAIVAGAASIVVQLRRRSQVRQFVTCHRCGTRLPRDQRFVGIERTRFGHERWVCWHCAHPTHHGHDPYNPWR